MLRDGVVKRRRLGGWRCEGAPIHVPESSRGREVEEVVSKRKVEEERWEEVEVKKVKKVEEEEECFYVAAAEDPLGLRAPPTFRF